MISTACSSLPAWLLFLIIVGGAMITSCVGLLLTRRQRKFFEDHSASEAVNIVFANISVIYAVLLAFLVISVWDAFGAAQQSVSNEASAIVTTARYTTFFPANMRQQAHDHLRNYTEMVIHDEWHAMQGVGEENFGSPKALREMRAIWDVYQKKLPGVTANSDGMKSLDDLSRLRVLRLMSNENVIPDYLWFVLLVGAISVIYLCMLLRVQNERLHLLLIALMAGSIAICIWLVAITNNPFGGDIQVSSAPLEYALHIIDSLPR